MTIVSISTVRGFVLAFAVGALLSGTVLFSLLRRLLREWIQSAQRVTSPRASGTPSRVMRVVDNDGYLRAWQFVCAAAGFLLWWYLGTANGAAWLTGMLRSH